MIAEPSHDGSFPSENYVECLKEKCFVVDSFVDVWRIESYVSMDREKGWGQ